jgi:hypothetical protein
MRESAKRGVWVAPYLIDGHQVVIAVASKGHIVASVVLHPRLVAAEIERYLAHLLETVDPRPMRLHADSPVAALGLNGSRGAFGAVGAFGDVSSGSRDD